MTPCAKRALWVVPKRHISNTYNNTYNKTNNNTYIHTKINYVRENRRTYMIIQEKESITGDLLDDIILRGTDDIDFHMSPTDKYILNVSELDSEPVFKKGVDLLLKHIKKDSKIALPVDADLDGYTSASVFVIAMNELNVNIDALIDEGKTHGLTVNIMNDIIGNYDLVIIPDAGSNDIKQHQTLLDNEIHFIVL